MKALQHEVKRAVRPALGFIVPGITVVLLILSYGNAVSAATTIGSSGNGDGVYLPDANSAKMYNNSFPGNATRIFQPGGVDGVFSQSAPAGGNLDSNYNSAARGRADANAGKIGSGSGSFTATADTVAPVISNITPSGWIASANPVISANFSDSGSGVNAASAVVNLDGGTLGGCTVTAGSISCPASGLTSGLHNYTVSVRDRAGNLATSTGSFSVDLIAPAVINLSPSGAINATTATLSATYSDSSGSGIDTASVKVYLDGTALGNCAVGQTNVSCPTTGIGQGMHSFTISVKDLAGNAAAGSGSFRVDRVAPVVGAITPSGTVNSATVNVHASYSDSGSGVNAASASVSIDGAALSGCTTTAGSVSCPASGLRQGGHTITVGVKDLAGNAGAGSGSFTVDSVDATPPIIGAITPAGTITTDSATVQVYYTETGSGVSSAASYVYLDSVPMTGCTYTSTVVSCPVTGLLQGSHIITGQIYDNAGNHANIQSADFMVNVSNKPNLVLQVNGTAQLSGTQLQIPMRIHNAGSSTAYAVGLTAGTSSNGIIYTKPGLPYGVASKISGGSNSSTFILTYNVPDGIASFDTYWVGTATNASGGDSGQSATTFNYNYRLQISGYGPGGGGSSGIAKKEPWPVRVAALSYSAFNRINFLAFPAFQPRA